MPRDAITLEALERVYPLLDLLQVGFVLVDATGEVRHATGPAQRVLQVRRLDRAALSEILGDQTDELIAPVLDGRAWTTRWRERRTTGPQGDELDLAMRSVAIDGADGTLLALLAIYDVSAEIGLHRRYKALLARQEAINEELRHRIATELRAHEDDVAQFSELLQVAPSIFGSFVAEAATAVRAVSSLVGAGFDDDAAVIALRESHTLKGNARGLGLNFIAGRAHAVEDLIAQARDVRKAPDAAVLEAAVADLRRATDRAVSLRGGLESGGGGAAETRAAALAELAGVLAAARDSLAADHPARAHVVRGLEAVDRMARVPLSQLLHYLRITARAVAAAAGQDEPILEVRGDDLAVPATIHAALQTALPHLVRNAIVHGIEPAAERARAGKPTAGMITVEARCEDAALIVVISDDGRGIDRARLAETLGQPDAALDALVFHPGLSSRAGVDLDAGRGIGAAAARDAITAIGGTLTVTSEPGRGTTFTATLYSGC